MTEKLEGITTQVAKPHTRRHTDLTVLAVLLAHGANFRSGRVPSTLVSNYVNQLGWGRWRWRKALDSAKDAGLIKSRTQVNLEAYVHQQNADTKGWTPFTRGALVYVSTEHELSTEALTLLCSLLIWYPYSHAVTTTITSIARRAQMAHRTCRKGLDELTTKGLINSVFQRGMSGEVRLTVFEALVSPEITAKRRSERRKDARCANSVVKEIERVFSLSQPLSNRVERVVESVLQSTNLQPTELPARLLAMGALDNARSIEAVIVNRLHALSHSSEQANLVTNKDRQASRAFKAQIEANSNTLAVEQAVRTRELAFLDSVLPTETSDVIYETLRRNGWKGVPQPIVLTAWMRSVLSGSPPEQYRARLIAEKPSEATLLTLAQEPLVL